MVDSEMLILEVESHPCLWNIGDDKYTDRNARKEAWEEVATVVYSNWEKNGMNNEAKTDELQKRWRNIRDCYTKEKRENKGEKHGMPKSKRRKYIYFEMLTFLDQTIDLRIVPSTMNGNENDKESAPVEEIIDTPPLSDSSVKKVKNSHKTGMTDFQSRLLQLLESKKRQSTQREEEEEDAEIDEDKMFLMSLLPRLKKLDSNQKYDFKIHMLQMMKNIELSASTQDTNWPNSHISASPIPSTTFTPTHANFFPPGCLKLEP